MSTNIEYILANHCAPTLLGLKSANLISIKINQAYHLKKLLHCLSISYFSFGIYGPYEIFFLFCPSLLKNKLLKEEIRGLFYQLNYPSCLLRDILYHLKKRYYLFKMGRNEFPHELGLLLDYPLSDVTAFIQNKGHNYLINGYWKVYSNQQEALAIFKIYDFSKHFLVNLLCNGYSFQEIFSIVN